MYTRLGPLMVLLLCTTICVGRAQTAASQDTTPKLKGKWFISVNYGTVSRRASARVDQQGDSLSATSWGVFPCSNSATSEAPVEIALTGQISHGVVELRIAGVRERNGPPCTNGQEIAVGDVFRGTPAQNGREIVGKLLHPAGEENWIFIR